MASHHQDAPAGTFSCNLVPCPVGVCECLDLSATLLPIEYLHRSWAPHQISTRSFYLYQIQSGWSRHVICDILCCKLQIRPVQGEVFILAAMPRNAVASDDCRYPLCKPLDSSYSTSVQQGVDIGLLFDIPACSTIKSACL